MLTQLIINDLAIINKLCLDFDYGMTVLTGETGAGKSILLDALGLILGDRADVNIIDLGSIAERQPEVVTDFPHEKSRLIQRGSGYKNTIVNGQIILENDELTGNRNGRILRSTD